MYDFPTGLAVGCIITTLYLKGIQLAVRRYKAAKDAIQAKEIALDPFEILPEQFDTRHDSIH